jgi:hypothetical protein
MVTLALIYTSIYNVCHSKLSMILEGNHKAAFRVCPQLRAQLLFPLFQKTGEELLDKLKHAIKKRDGPPTEQYLPLCLVMWFLMLIYQHSFAQTEQADLYLLAADQESPRCTLGKTDNCRVAKYYVCELMSCRSKRPDGAYDEVNHHYPNYT